MTANTQNLEQIRLELTRLELKAADLQTQLAEARLRYSHAVNAKNCVVATAGMCMVSLYDNFTVSNISNSHAVLGHMDVGVPIVEAVHSPGIRQYFESVRKLGHTLQAIAETETGSWSRIFPSGRVGQEALDDWITIPPGTWETMKNSSRVRPDAQAGEEHYLVSPTELIGPTDDFRIEYTARAEGHPMDLSVVVGCEVQDNIPVARAARPDHKGYCFAFGAMENTSTELQRSLETVCQGKPILIQPGRSHRCVAERLGGVLRFEVDGAEAYSSVDCLPLIGKGYGYVGLYTCAPNHTFEDLIVSTRPTCLSAEILTQIHALRDIVLELDDAPARFVEVHYLGNNLFLFKDVSKEKSSPTL